MRTTIQIDDELLKQVKQLAIRSGKSLTAIIEESLRDSLARQSRAERQEPVHLKTFSGKGTQPRVDLDDTAALLDVMESSDDPH